MQKNVYLLEGARSAIGAFGQGFLDLDMTEMGVCTAEEALRRAQISKEQVDHVIYGNVMQTASNAAYLARHIALQTGIGQHVPAQMVNRLCASGMQSVVSAAHSIMLEEAQCVLAGGIENMSQAPHIDHATRFTGKKLGNVQLEDSILNALTDRYSGCGMGMTAENVARKYAISREDQDEFAALSHQRAAAAKARLADEIVSIEVKTRRESHLVEHDEHVKANTNLASLSKLKPAFMKDGSVTAGNSSGINDGAVSLVIVGEKSIGDQQPLARIVSWGICGVDPELMGMGPVPASEQALQRAGLTIKEMDLIEINEAFAAQYLAVEKTLGLNRAITNVNGGAIALGHPLGASGARVLLTLAYELRRRNGRFGLAALCVGGGQGIAMIIERIDNGD